MRKFIHIMALLVAFSIAPIQFVGCKTASTQRVAVNTLFSVHKTVDEAYNAYWALIIKGTLATNSVPKVAASYNQFQNVFNGALLLVAGNTNALVSPTVWDAATSFTDTVTAAKRGAL